jgi:hypothetical protein
VSAWRDLLIGLFLFRRGPADLPHSPSLLAALAFASVLMRYAAGSLQHSQVDDGVVAVASTAIELMLLQWTLLIGGRSARFVQTASAMLIVRLTGQAAVVLMLLPVAPMPEDVERWSPAQTTALSLSLPVAIWSVALCTRMLRDALEIGVGRALLLVLAMTFATMILSTSLGLAFQ